MNKQTNMINGADSLAVVNDTARKKQPSDFLFGKVLGEGSYSTVFLAKDISNNKEFAVKVLDKKQILKEKKQKYVTRERDVLQRISHPFFVKLYSTFQDPERLYFVLSYARRGELLNYISKLGCFDENCTRFYSAEIVLALEYLKTIGIIHRDLKPENILLSEEMHILVTDFGSAKMLNMNQDESAIQEEQRRNSFVGTAQYVSPEVVATKSAYFSSDLWALGCIIYQLLSGKLPFWGGHEYQIMQKVSSVEFKFPDGFNSVARDLVDKLLVHDPTKRIGCQESGGFDTLKSHPFYNGIIWETLPSEKPPELLPYLPAIDTNSENLWSEYKPGLSDEQFAKLVQKNLSASRPDLVSDFVASGEPSSQWPSEQERTGRLERQRQSDKYHRFVEGHLIIKQGLVDKRKGLFARRRMLLLTEGPHLYYVDPASMILKGQIPWTAELRAEAKNFKTYFVHTPNRTYYLEDPDGNALKWCKKIEEVSQHYFGSNS